MSNTKTANNHLPDRWQYVRLEEVISEALSGFAIGERDPNGIIQLRMNNVDTRGNLIWDEFIRVPVDKSTVERYQLRRGDVVFNNTNSTELVGKSAFFMEYKEPVVYSNHFTRLRTKQDYLDPRFLAFWLGQLWNNGVFASICNRWIGQSAVKADLLLRLEIPLPPLAEQKRIVLRLTEQISTIEQARQAAEAQLEAISALTAALLRKAFNGEL